MSYDKLANLDKLLEDISKIQEEDKIRDTKKQEITKEFFTNFLSLQERLHEGESTGDKFVDVLILNYCTNPANLMSEIKKIKEFPSQAEPHRGKVIVVEYTTSEMFSSGSFDGSTPATYFHYSAAQWGTIAKTGNILLIENYPKSNFSTREMKTININTGGVYNEYNDVLSSDRKVAKIKANMPYFLPFSEQAKYVFGKEAEELIEAIQKGRAAKSDSDDSERNPETTIGWNY